MVPKGWKETTLGEILTFKNGLNFSKSSSGENIKIVGVKDFKDLAELKDTSTLESIQVESKIRDAELLRSGDLLFVRSNGNKQLIGRCLFFPSVNERLSFSGFTIRGRVSDGKTLPVYASHLVRSELIKSQFSKNGAGTNISNLSQDVLSQATLNLPPTAEQTKIARILSTWDKVIATTERLLANSQQQKQALMQQLLTGQKRFAGFTDEWITVEFDELLGIEIGGTPSRSNPAYWDTEKTTNNRWLSIADLKGNLITDTSEYISDLGAAKSNTKLIPAGTIVMSFKLTIGRRAILAADTYTNEAICAFKIKDPKRLSNDFLFHALCLVNFEKDIDQAVKGKTLNKAKLKQLTLSLPSLLEQQKIAQVLSTTDAEISNLQAQLAKLKLEKKALMQQLLTGQRRVKLDADAAA